MAIAFTGIISGKRDYVHLSIDGVKYTLSTKYQEKIDSERITSERWNGTAYERIHRVIRAWKSIQISTGKMQGTAAEIESFVSNLIKSGDIFIYKSSSVTPPVAVAPAAPWIRVTLEDSSLNINDPVMQRGDGIALSFKHSVEI